MPVKLVTALDYQSYGGQIAQFTVDSGVTGSAVTPVDVRAPHALWRVRIDDCTGIAGGTRLRFQAGWDVSDTMCDVWRTDGNGIFETAHLPTSGSFGMLVPELSGVRRVRAIFTNNTTGAVTLTFLALDGAKDV